MAKTIAELSAFCDVLSDRLDASRQEVADLWVLTEKLTDQLQTTREEAARTREEASPTRRLLDEARERGQALERARADLRQEAAVLRPQLQDHVAHYQEWDRRKWGLILLLVGAVLSLASGLIVSLSKK